MPEKNPKLRNPLAIGLDAEFILGAPGNREFTEASRVFDSSGNIGVDGAGSAVEVRPLPSDNVEEVVSCVKEALDLMFTAAPETRKVSWSCGHYFEPVGLHIHFNRNMSEDPGNIALLDALLSAPMLCVTDMKSAKCRRDSGYGKLSDNRNDHRTEEGKPRTEYRSLGSVWGTPKSLATILKIAQKISGIEGREDEEEQTIKFGVGAKAIFGSQGNMADEYNSLNTLPMLKWRDSMLTIMGGLDYWRDVVDEYGALLTGPTVPVTDLKELWRVSELVGTKRKARISDPVEYLKLRSNGAIEPFTFHKQVSSLKTKLRITPLKGAVVVDEDEADAEDEQEA